jgi:hypothetical protein
MGGGMKNKAVSKALVSCIKQNIVVMNKLSFK